MQGRDLAPLVVADGSRTARLILEDLLGQAGYAVRSACQREALADILESREADLILVSHQWLDVLQNCRWLTETPVTQTSPSVILTLTRDSAIDPGALRRIGADDLLYKPFHTDEVLLRVSSLLQRRSRLHDESAVTQRDRSMSRIDAAHQHPQHTQLTELRQQLKHHLEDAFEPPLRSLIAYTKAFGSDRYDPNTKAALQTLQEFLKATQRIVATIADGDADDARRHPQTLEETCSPGVGRESQTARAGRSLTSRSLVAETSGEGEPLGSLR